MIEMVKCPEIYLSASSIRTKTSLMLKSRFLSVDLKISFPNLFSQKWLKNTSNLLLLAMNDLFICAVYDRHSSLIAEVSSRSG